MPVWKIREKGCTPEGRVYLLVDFWFGDDTGARPDLTNDFVLDVPRHEYPINVDTMARQYVGLRGIVRRMNRQHGTTHNPDTWFGYVAPAVRAKIAELEAQ